MYLARDKNDSIYLFSIIPKRYNEVFLNQEGDYDFCEIQSNLFPEVTWKNSPVEIELKIKEK